MWLIPTKEEYTPEERWSWFMEHFTPQMEKALFAEARRILGNTHDAEDVLQEALIRGATRCWQLRDERKLFQWMYTIIRHLSFDKHNDRVHAAICSMRLATGIIYNTPSPEDFLIDTQNQEVLLEAIDHLRSPEKEILIYKMTTNMKLVDIARQLHLNYHTTRTKYRRTLEHLARLLR